MIFEPKPYGVTIEVSKEDLLKTTYNGPSPALKELLDATSIKYTAEWFKNEYEWALEKEPMSYHEPELKAFEEIKVILAGNPDRLNDGEFIYSIVKSVFMKTYSDIIPDEKMLKAAFDAVQIHIIPELKKEHSKLNFSIAGLQEYCATTAKQYGATATFEEKANQMAYRLTVSYGNNSYYENFTQKFLLETPNKELFYILRKAIEKGVKPLSKSPSNTPLGTTGTNKSGGDLTFSSGSWGNSPLTYEILAKTYADLTVSSSTPGTGGTTPVAPAPKPKAPEKPFSIDEMYAAPKPSWAKKDKHKKPIKGGMAHTMAEQTELDKAFEQLVAEKAKAFQEIVKLEAEGKPITQTLQAAPLPKPSTIAKVKNQIDKAMEAMHDETMKYIYGTSKEKK